MELVKLYRLALLIVLWFLIVVPLAPMDANPSWKTLIRLAIRWKNVVRTKKRKLANKLLIQYSLKGLFIRKSVHGRHVGLKNPTLRFGGIRNRKSRLKGRSRKHNLLLLLPMN